MVEALTAYYMQTTLFFQLQAAMDHVVDASDKSVVNLK